MCDLPPRIMGDSECRGILNSENTSAEGWGDFVGNLQREAILLTWWHACGNIGNLKPDPNHRAMAEWSIAAVTMLRRSLIVIYRHIAKSNPECIYRGISGRWPINV